MPAGELLLAAAIGAVCLAIAAMLWVIAARLRDKARLDQHYQRRDPGAGVWIEAFDTAILRLDREPPVLAAGEEAFAACAAALDVAAMPEAVLTALAPGAGGPARRLRALVDAGEACDFEVRGPKGSVLVQGRPSGAVAWLALRLATAGQTELGAAFAALLDGQGGAAWIVNRQGRLVWANRAWLAAAEALSAEDALARGLNFNAGAQTLFDDVAACGQRREGLRWTTVRGQRRAFQVMVEPLPGGALGAYARDVSETEESREALRLHVAAHDETLNRLADGVAIFSPSKALAFHNTAFADLWALEPAWLLERPSHGEILDRLRQRRRLPETVDYGKWKAAELAHYEAMGPAPDDLWTLPDGRTLRVVRQPHPLGGLLLLFSDVTGELRLKAQFNALIQVQQATLDKLSDAVAVFGSDGRLRLHNEAFEKFWNIPAQQLAAAADFDGVVELCLPRLHDQQFWREIKGRVGDPDPQARIAVSGETRTSDKRIVAYQTRPLPDGATLLAFTDITDTRGLERAVAEKDNALAEAERLKRDFVGNVSYELRTPLTTIIGYAELLDRLGEGLSDRGRSHVAAVRTAASQLARSIDDVLDMAQIDAGEMALELGDVDITDLLDQTRDRWAAEAEGAKIALSVECEPAVGVIRGDARRLAQAIDHLVENALRQAPPETQIRLLAHQALGEVQVQVADTGRGIPFHVQAHIFDRFIGRDRGGPGLGLALVKALVELHGGWVALESEPGKGSTFTLHLPEVAQAAAGQPELF